MSEKKVDIYSVEYLQQYAKGLLSPQEMHVLEKQALDDPFLADAMDGYIMIADDGKEIKIPNITEPPAKLVKFKPWKTVALAASILFTVGIGSYIVFHKSKENITVTKNENTVDKKADNIVYDKDSSFVNSIKDTTARDIVAHNDIKRKLETPLVRPSQVSGSLSGAQANMSTTVPAPTTYSPSAQAAEVPSAITDDAKTDAASINKDIAAVPKPSITNTELERRKTIDKVVTDSIKSNDVAMNQSQNRNVQTDNNILRSNQAAGNIAKRYGDKYNLRGRANNVINNNIEGLVVNKNNEPLAFANLNFKNKNIESYANSSGYFNFKSIDTTLVLEVAANGFASRQITIEPSNKPIRIVLDEVDAPVKSTDGLESNNLEKKAIELNNIKPEMEANKYKAKAKKMTEKEEEQVNIKPGAPAKVEYNLQSMAAKIYILPESNYTGDIKPSVSWGLYETYLNNNSVFNKKTNKNKVSGLVIVSFTIDDKGLPTNVQVVKSLDPQQDADAVRLIKNGPTWNASGTNKSKQLSLIFR